MQPKNGRIVGAFGVTLIHSYQDLSVLQKQVSYLIICLTLCRLSEAVGDEGVK